ncbi:MAG: S49 family peptidase [Alphaproteobacteria bacterium]|nr:S49 family peptidase [Alphaproteobacteria bacterium]MBU0858603.1 S49 family peptidase [Alphaproteobacteria bacterium]
MTDIYEHRDEDGAEAEKFLEKDNLKNLPVIGKYLEKKPKVTVLRLSGVIADEGRRKASISYARYAKLIDKAFEKADCAVALVINSPGGMPAQAELIGAHIRRAALEKKIPVIGFVEDVAASGGYWLACAADAIYAQNTSIIGSIGVVSASFGFEDFIAKHSIHRRMHTAGKDKSFLDPFLPERESDVQRLKEIQHEIHAVFIDWVKERRGNRLRGADKEMFQGAFWTAGIAMDYGLIDGIADMRGYMREKFGKKVKFVEISPEKKLFSLPSVPGISADDVIGAVENESAWNRLGL